MESVATALVHHGTTAANDAGVEYWIDISPYTCSRVPSCSCSYLLHGKARRFREEKNANSHDQISLSRDLYLEKVENISHVKGTSCLDNGLVERLQHCRVKQRAHATPQPLSTRRWCCRMGLSVHATPPPFLISAFDDEIGGAVAWIDQCMPLCRVVDEMVVPSYPSISARTN